MIKIPEGIVVVYVSEEILEVEKNLSNNNILLIRFLPILFAIFSVNIKSVSRYYFYYLKLVCKNLLEVL